MDEFWHIRYHKLHETGSRYILDLNSTLRNIIEDTILFDAYRYGGNHECAQRGVGPNAEKAELQVVSKHCLPRLKRPPQRQVAGRVRRR